MIIDGRQLAQERSEEVRALRQKFGALSLGLVMATESPVTRSYVGIKKRAAEALDIAVAEYRLPDTATTKEIIAEVKKAADAGHDGIILQLPLPTGVDVEAAKNAIPKELDVDVLSDAAFAEFAKNNFPAIPPVPAAMWYVAKRGGVALAGKTVVVVGNKGRLVGRPAEVLFRRLGATVIGLDKGDDIAGNVRTADIIISGTGVAGLIKPAMIKKGTVILDGGTSSPSGQLLGDADPACAEKASLFTPVPGGVGPIAVVEIFANLIALKK